MLVAFVFVKQSLLYRPAWLGIQVSLASAF